MNSRNYTRDDCGHEPLPLAAEGGAEALGAADEEPDDEVGVLLHGLAVHPHAEPQEVQEALTLHRVLHAKREFVFTGTVRSRVHIWEGAQLLSHRVSQNDTIP